MENKFAHMCTYGSKNLRKNLTDIYIHIYVFKITRTFLNEVGLLPVFTLFLFPL